MIDTMLPDESVTYVECALPGYEDAEFSYHATSAIRRLPTTT